VVREDIVLTAVVVHLALHNGGRPQAGKTCTPLHDKEPHDMTPRKLLAISTHDPTSTTIMCARCFESRVYKIVPSLEQHTTSLARHNTALRYCYWYFSVCVSSKHTRTSNADRTGILHQAANLFAKRRLNDRPQRIEAARTTRLLVVLIISSAQKPPFCFLCATVAGEEDRKNTVQALCCGCMDMGKSWLQAEDDSVRRLLSSRRTKSERIRREDGEPCACRVAR
jgi:hypothetical protein